MLFCGRSYGHWITFAFGAFVVGEISWGLTAGFRGSALGVATVTGGAAGACLLSTV